MSEHRTDIPVEFELGERVALSEDELKLLEQVLPELLKELVWLQDESER